MLIRESHHNAIAVLQPVCRRLSGAALPALDRLIGAYTERGTTAVLIDLGQVNRINRAGLAALTELTSRWHGPGRHGMIDLGLCGLTRQDRELVRALGLDALLPTYRSVPAALATERFRRRALAGTRAILLSPRGRRQLGPLTARTPLPMLDIVGKPLVERATDHLLRFGVRDITLTPCPRGAAIPRHFRGRGDLSLFYAHGELDGPNGGARPCASSAETLSRLHRHHSSFEDDTIVMEIDAVGGIDLARMMDLHRASNALVTVACHGAPDAVGLHGHFRPGRDGRARSFVPRRRADCDNGPLASTGVYILSPESAEILGDPRGRDFAFNVLPRLMAAGHRIQIFDSSPPWFPLASAGCYFDLCTAILHGDVPQCRPAGVQTGERCWRHMSAEVADSAEVSGATYIGREAIVEGGAMLHGTTIVGDHCRVAGRSLLRNAIIWPETDVQDGAIVDTTIASGTWAINHRYATGAPRAILPLEHVVPLGQADMQGAFARSARIA